MILEIFPLLYYLLLHHCMVNGNNYTFFVGSDQKIRSSGTWGFYPMAKKAIGT